MILQVCVFMIYSNIMASTQGLGQDLEAGSPNLANVIFLGVLFF